MNKGMITSALEAIDNSFCCDGTVTLNGYGKYSLDINISAEMDNDIDETLYSVQIYAPQDMNNIKCDDDRYLGSAEDLERDEMIEALEGIYNGDYIITVSEGIDRRNLNLTAAIKNYTAEEKTKETERVR